MLAAAVIGIAQVSLPAVRAGHLVDRAGDKVFLRGIGWSPWHMEVGWGLTPEIIAGDRELLRGMHVNALRTWGGASRKAADEWYAEGFYWVPQVHRLEVPLGVFAAGDPSRCPAWTHADTLSAMRETATKLATELKEAPGIIAYNLGNEYSCVGVNKSGYYQYGGFDEFTLAEFRKWLKKRFPTPEDFERHYGETPPDFDTYRPPTASTKDPLFGEWWHFQRDQCYQFLRAGHEVVKAIDPDRPTTYARLCGGRWDPATEDLILDFSKTVGDNLYYHWDKDWYKYCLRLARHAGTGPGKPVLLTESGIRSKLTDSEAARLLKQMLMCSIVHPEVAGIAIFEYCDEWYNHPGNPKLHDARVEANWGLVTADRKPKGTYRAAAEVYGLFERMNDFIIDGEAAPLVIVSGQETDWWRGSQSVSHAEVVELLYRNGVPFGLWGDSALLSRLNPECCSRLVLCDTHLWAEPDGSRNVSEAILDFARRGGRVLYLCEEPFQKVSGYHDVPAVLRDGEGRIPFGQGEFTIVRELPEGRRLWQVLRDFLGPVLEDEPVQNLRAQGAEDLIWRVLEAREEQRLIVVNAAAEPVHDVRIRLNPGVSAEKAALYAADGGELAVSGPNGVLLSEINTYAIIDLPRA